ncbi:MAG: ArsR/SmtB family transcription factor [Campylobacterota bacterium]
MDDFLHTIGSINDETRIRLLRFIHKHESVCVCDLENSFDMIQSRISRHLKILKDGGFLQVRREGRWAYYSVRFPLDAFRTAILNEISYLDTGLPNLNKGCEND